MVKPCEIITSAKDSYDLTSKTLSNKELDEEESARSGLTEIYDNIIEELNEQNMDEATVDLERASDQSSQIEGK